MRIQRVYIPEKENAFLAEQELDETLKPTEALIKTHYSAISAGTECARYLGWEGDIFPTASGSANIGEILAVGSEVKNFAVGDLVTSFTNHDSHVKCDTLPLDYGYNGHRIGVKISPSVFGPEVALAYHFALGMAAIRESGVTLGDDVLVIGGGLIGNAAAQLFKCAGAFVMLADLSEPRLAIAKTCGITEVINSSKVNLAEAVKAWTKGRMLHIGVLALEGAHLLPELVPLTRNRGQIILLGGYRLSHEVDIHPVLRQLQKGSRRLLALSGPHYPIPELPYHRYSTLGHFRQIMALMEDGRLRAKPLVQLVLPQDCQQVFRDLIHNKDKYLGAVFNWTK